MKKKENKNPIQKNLSSNHSQKKILTSYCNQCLTYTFNNRWIIGTLYRKPLKKKIKLRKKQKKIKIKMEKKRKMEIEKKIKMKMEKKLKMEMEIKMKMEKEICYNSPLVINQLLNYCNNNQEVDLKNILYRTRTVGKNILKILQKYIIKERNSFSKQINDTPQFVNLNEQTGNNPVDNLYISSIFPITFLKELPISDKEKINQVIGEYCKKCGFPMIPTDTDENEKVSICFCPKDDFIRLAILIYIVYELVQAFSNIYSKYNFGVKFDIAPDLDYSLDDCSIKKSANIIKSHCELLNLPLDLFCTNKKNKTNTANQKTPYEKFYEKYGFDIQIALSQFLAMFNTIEMNTSYLFNIDKLGISLNNNIIQFSVLEYHNSLFSICWSKIKYMFLPKEEEKTAIKCQRCNRIFSSQSNSTKYCSDCSPLVHNEKSANSYNKLKVLFEEFKNYYDTIPADKKSTLLKDYPYMELFNKPNISEFKKLKYKNKIEKLELYIEALKNIINVTK